MMLRRLVILGLFAAGLLILTTPTRDALATALAIVFKNGTPKAGDAAGKINVDVEWTKCAGVSSVEGAMYKETFPGGQRAETIISTKAVVNVAANGTKSWVWTGLTTGDKICVYATVYDACNEILAEKKSGDVTVP